MIPTLSLSSLNRKAALGRKFFSLSLQQPDVIVGHMAQPIRIKQVMLQFQEVLSVCDVEF